MDDAQRQATARLLLGHGAAGQAADIRKLRERYGQLNVEAQSNGQSMPSFEDWAKEFMQAQGPQPTVVQN